MNSAQYSSECLWNVGTWINAYIGSYLMIVTSDVLLEVHAFWPVLPQDIAIADFSVQ